jgi:hypothetical protein
MPVYVTKEYFIAIYASVWECNLASRYEEMLVQM